MLCVFRVCDCDLRVVVFEWLSVCEVRCVICVWFCLCRGPHLMFVVYVVHMLCCSHVELVCVFSIPLCLRVFPCVCCGDSLSVCCVCVCVCGFLCGM